jgi:hypothetical protein
MSYVTGHLLEMLAAWEMPATITMPIDECVL